MNPRPPSLIPARLVATVAPLLVAPFLVPLLVGTALAAPPSIHAHDLTVELHPAEATLQVVDRLTVVRNGGGELRFSLNATLDVTAARIDGRQAAGLERVEPAGEATLAWWKIDITPGPGPRGVLEIAYEGPLARAREGSPLLFVPGTAAGVAGPTDAYLPAGYGWYADTGNLARYDLTVLVPAPLLAVTQGTLLSRGRTETERSELKSVESKSVELKSVSRWRGKYATDGLSLLVGAWAYSERKAGRVTLGAYVPAEHASTAPALLQGAANDLERHTRRLAPYAYDRFDLIAGRFCRPPVRMTECSVFSGTTPIRSYPGGRDLIRSWWGRLVMEAPDSAPWTDALADYCDTYMAAEKAGTAAALRREGLVRQSLAAQLAQSAHSARGTGTGTGTVDVSELWVASDTRTPAIFHMLRRELGDDVFWATLADVATKHRGERTGWSQLREAFEQRSRRNLADFFERWLTRSGAPVLAITDARVESRGGRLRVVGTLAQELGPDEAPWRVGVPVVVEHLEGREELVVEMTDATAAFAIQVPSLPLRVAADPEFHVLRHIPARDLPGTVATMLSRPDKVFVHADGATAVADALREIATVRGGTVISASDAPSVPEPGTSLLVVGRPDAVPLLATLKATLPHALPKWPSNHLLLTTSRSPVDPDEFITALVGPPESLAGAVGEILRAPTADALRRTPEGAWGAAPSPTTRGRTERTLLPDLRLAADPARAMAVVDELSQDRLGGRVAGTRGARLARQIVTEWVRLAGAEVDEQPFTFNVRRQPSDAQPLTVGGAAVNGAVALVASPVTSADGVVATGVESDLAEDVAGRAFVAPLPAATDDPLATIRELADLAQRRGAVALILRQTAPADAWLARLWATPETLHTETLSALASSAPNPKRVNSLFYCARAAAETGSLTELALPTVVVGVGWDPATAPLVIRVRFDEHVVEGVNVIARLRPERGSAQPGKVVLTARLDHLGAGHGGAGHGGAKRAASAAAALAEAAHIVAASRPLLTRDVEFVFLDASMWGDRGALVYAAAQRAATSQTILGVLEVGPVGDRGVGDVALGGVTDQPRLATLVTAALETTGFQVTTTGSAPVTPAFGALHAVSLVSTDLPPVTDPPLTDPFVTDPTVTDPTVTAPNGDTERVDSEKVARIARALAVAALALAGN